jgi:hypothetical protein
MTNDELDALQERLARECISSPGINGERRMIALNPDGPDALAAIKALRERATKLEGRITVSGYVPLAEFDAMQDERDEAGHEFKNFHRMLCERFAYRHDEKDWKRDQVSLMEHIAKQRDEAVNALGDLLDAVDAHNAANGKAMVDPHATDEARSVLSRLKEPKP